MSLLNSSNDVRRFSSFLDSSGVFLPETFRPDNLHPLAKGYDIWGEAVKDKLAELMK